MIKFRQLNGKTVIEFVDRAELLKLIGKRKAPNYLYCKRIGFNPATGWNEFEIWLNDELVGYSNQEV